MPGVRNSAACSVSCHPMIGLLQLTAGRSYLSTVKSIQNKVWKLIFELAGFSYITTFMCSCHWLCDLKFRTLLPAYEAIVGPVPAHKDPSGHKEINQHTNTLLFTDAMLEWSSSGYENKSLTVFKQSKHCRKKQK